MDSTPHAHTDTTTKTAIPVVDARGMEQVFGRTRQLPQHLSYFIVRSANCTKLLKGFGAFETRSTVGWHGAARRRGSRSRVGEAAQSLNHRFVGNGLLDIGPESSLELLELLVTHAVNVDFVAVFVAVARLLTPLMS